MNEIKIINDSGYALPEYKTPRSAGCDLHAVLPHPKRLLPLERVTIPTGICVALPDGCEGQVRPRSGLTRNNGIVAAVGTIDADYRGEIGVTVFNLSGEEYTIQPGERIAQLVIAPVIQAKWEEATELDETERGAGGFGSTGK